MRAEKLDNQAIVFVYKNKPPMQSSAALEGAASQLADAKAAVEMRFTEFLTQAA